MSQNRLLLITWLLIVTAFSQAQGPSQKELNNAAKDGANWLYVDHDYLGARYSPLSDINSKNVARLDQVCSHTFPEKSPSQTAPLVYGGTI